MSKLVENCYISGACNYTPTCADWGNNNLICYGSCNAVFIYRLNEGGGKIIDVLAGHTNRVNSVKWIRGKGSETELVSGAADGQAIVWSLIKGTYIPHVLVGHNDSVTIVDGIYKDDLTIVLTASMDSTVKVWSRKCDNEFFLVQNIDFGYGMCVGFGCIYLPHAKSILLAVGLDDSSIALYSLTDFDQLTFVSLDVLKGHEDWVRGLDFISESNGDVLLATASQDCFVRLWRFRYKQEELSEKDVIMNCSDVHINDISYTISLVAILTGHEGWIYSVNWDPKGKRLLTASIDKSLIIWEKDAGTNLWLENMRVGEVGGNTLGFYGGKFGPHGRSILAHSYHGAFHIWHYNLETKSWVPDVTVGGHFGEVVDLCWEPDGEFLVSVSMDQTTRIHAPWIRPNTGIITWHEIARPQVHGYDMSSIAILSRYKFVSSADEKVIRAFQAPVNFRNNFVKICNVTENSEDNDVCAKGASVPSLGLSNKAIYENDNSEQVKLKEKEFYPEESHFILTNLQEPPTEETLIQNTLWPEIQKLYGHGYEVYCLASNADGSLVASACKSTTQEHSSILLWETSSWKCIQKLISHTLTVVQLTFSPDSNHLLSVSRDRRWSIFTKNPSNNLYELAGTTNKSNGIHKRIIWCCAFSHDSKYFATGSRDGKLVIWHKNNEIEAKSTLGQYESLFDSLDLCGESVTAVTFAPALINGNYLIAIGLESGSIHLYTWLKNGSLVTKLDNNVAHHLTVKKLAFRPKFGQAGDKTNDDDILQLASCSSDHSVRIYNIHFKEI